MTTPKFSIVTPSFRNSNWLKLCIASVADQKGVEIEHIVQDAGSDDGTLDWLSHDPRVRAYVEKDSGMYDAINRGLRRATGEILAYLNCDEQYLPGALKMVYDYFQSHPEVKVLFAGAIVVGPCGQFIAYRKAVRPLKYHVWVNSLPFFTCAAFFRRRLLDAYELFFDPQFRDVGDAVWTLRLLDLKVRTGILDQLTSAYTRTGDNMQFKPNAVSERQRLFLSAPLWARLAKPAFLLHHRFHKLMSGAYSQKPFNYAIYTLANPHQRTAFAVARPSFRLQIPV